MSLFVFSGFSTVSLVFLPAQNTHMLPTRPIYVLLGTTVRVQSSFFRFGNTRAKFRLSSYSANNREKLSFMSALMNMHIMHVVSADVNRVH